MTALLHAELIKLRTTRTFAAVAAAALALSLLVVILRTTLDSGLAAQDARSLFGGNVTGLFMLLLGAIGITGEWRHHTIATSILAAPHRVRLLAAKALSYAAAGVVLSLITTMATMLVGTLILSASGDATIGLVELDVLWRNLAIAALLGALGVGVGALVRNQIVAVTGLLIIGLFLEPTLSTLVPDVAQFGPMVGAPTGILGLDDANLLAPGLALAVSIGWASAAFATAAARLRGRDLV
jgi:ABC-2 type transport system permease protein